MADVSATVSVSLHVIIVWFLFLLTRSVFRLVCRLRRLAPLPFLSLSASLQRFHAPVEFPLTNVGLVASNLD
jgi:hypothetical protein